MGAVKKIYILHGWTTTTAKWNPFLEELKKEKITPIMLRIPGLTAPLKAPWTLDSYVEWLDKEIGNKKNVTILGHSNGGRIALAYSLKYPEKIKQLFLLDSAGIYHNDLLMNTKRNVFKILSKIGKKISNSNTARNTLYKLAGENDYKNASGATAQTMKNLISVDLSPILSKIKIPTVIIWGKEDKITPYKDAIIIRNGLSNSKLFPIESARHSPQFSNVSEITKIVKENLL